MTSAVQSHVPETMADLVELLGLYGMATSATIKPCTAKEIEDIRAAQRVARLPAQYEEFLRTMGKRAGELLLGTDFFYPFVVELAGEMRELVSDNGIEHLIRPGSVLVGMHQGYELYWLEPGNPSGRLFHYTEGRDAPIGVWPTLLDFLVAQAEDQKR